MAMNTPLGPDVVGIYFFQNLRCFSFSLHSRLLCPLCWKDIQCRQARSKFRWKWKKKRTRRLQKKRRKMRQRSKWVWGPQPEGRDLQQLLEVDWTSVTCQAIPPPKKIKKTVTKMKNRFGCLSVDWVEISDNELSSFCHSHSTSSVVCGGLRWGDFVSNERWDDKSLGRNWDDSCLRLWKLIARHGPD